MSKGIRLIGIVGKKGAGKDTTADYIVRRHGFVKRAYASPLKQACKALFSLTDSQLEDPVEKERVDDRWGKTPREVMQWLGTDVVRHSLGCDFWIRHMGFYRKDNPDERLVIPDVRFLNEAWWIRENGGILIRVVRPSACSTDTHASEVEQDEIEADYTIRNTTMDVETFYRTVLDPLFSNCIVID
jgi:hypothetical protein